MSRKSTYGQGLRMQGEKFVSFVFIKYFDNSINTFVVLSQIGSFKRKTVSFSARTHNSIKEA
jgi:hypothetical protein